MKSNDTKTLSRQFKETPWTFWVAYASWVLGNVLFVAVHYPSLNPNVMGEFNSKAILLSIVAYIIIRLNKGNQIARKTAHLGFAILFSIMSLGQIFGQQSL